MVTFKTMVGKTPQEVKQIFEDLGWPFSLRVVMVDGNPQVCIRNLDHNRINVATHNGIITEVVAIG